MVPTRRPGALDLADELDSGRLHRGAGTIHVVNEEGDDRAGGEEVVEVVAGAEEFHLSAIGHSQAEQAWFLARRLQAHHFGEEMAHRGELLGANAEPGE